MHCPAQTALFSVPSTDPLQNQGPLQPVFEDILGDLRGRRLAARLQLTLARLQPGVIAALRDGWLRAIETRLRSQRQRHAERLFTRRRFLLKGLLILSVALALGGRVAGYETGIMRTIGESLIIGGWAGVWLPLERIFYTGFPIGREIQRLKRLRDCDLQLRVQV